jgi:hypothetical protein
VVFPSRLLVYCTAVVDCAIKTINPILQPPPIQPAILSPLTFLHKHTRRSQSPPRASPVVSTLLFPPEAQVLISRGVSDITPPLDALPGTTHPLHVLDGLFCTVLYWRYIRLMKVEARRDLHPPVGTHYVDGGFGGSGYWRSLII